MQRSVDVILNVVPDRESRIGNAHREREHLVHPEALRPDAEQPQDQGAHDQAKKKWKILILHAANSGSNKDLAQRDTGNPHRPRRVVVPRLGRYRLSIKKTQDV